MYRGEGRKAAARCGLGCDHVGPHGVGVDDVGIQAPTEPAHAQPVVPVGPGMPPERMHLDAAPLERSHEGMILLMGSQDRRYVDFVATLAMTSSERRDDALEPSEWGRRS